MKSIQIENFKCFTNKVIPLNQLTVLTGANGGGKSTVIQALLFLRKTVEQCCDWDKELKEYLYVENNELNVALNGSYCLALGTSDLIIPKGESPDYCSITLTGNNPNTSINDSFQVVYNIDQEVNLWLKPVEIKDNTTDFESIFLQEFYYLNAERIGPRISQGIKFYDYPNAGYQGEFVAQLISDTESNYKFEVEIERIYPGSKNKRLEQQVNVWLNELMPGVSISAFYEPQTHSAQIRVDNIFTKGKGTIATNIGFGISYVLPIIVTGLIAKKNSIMIVENPEAHLHPSAQSKIGQFLAMVAKSGVNVIIETHSDHVINGIQIAVAKKDILPEQVTINFFSQEEGEKQPNVESISVTEKGELTKWPKGFFDQSQKDFAELFKMRKS